MRNLHNKYQDNVYLHMSLAIAELWHGGKLEIVPTRDIVLTIQ